MFDLNDVITYELCFPGAITGEAEINCPYCSEWITVPVDDPMGLESYQCNACQDVFDVDWGNGRVTLA